MHSRSICSSLLFCGAALGQTRVWTVHQGGGGQFTEIQPAIAAASPGDRIEVLGAYIYQGFTLAKGLDLEATQGASARGCSIELVPEGAWARVAGFKAVGPLISVSRCAGSVLLSRMETPPHSFGPGLSVGESAAVWVRDCTILGGSGSWTFSMPGSVAATLGNSNVTLQHCSIAGGAGVGAIPTYRLSSTAGGGGVSVVGGDVLIEECSVNGGPGGNGSGAAPPSPGGGGLGAYGAGVLVFGGASIRGGPYGYPSSGDPSSSIVGDRQFPTAVRVTTDCTLTGASSYVSVVPPLPYIVSSGTASIGGRADLTLRGPQGTAALLLLDFVHNHVPLYGIDGALLLPPASMAALFPVSIGSGGSLPLTFPVPNDPILRNRFAFFQAAGLAPGAPLPFLTNLGDFRFR
jgi:hypothetical protein